MMVKRKRFRSSAGIKVFVATLCLGGVLASIPISWSIREYRAQQAIISDTYKRKLPDYTSFEAVQSTQNSTTFTDGTASFDSFVKLSEKSTTEFLDCIRPIIGDDLYVGALAGVGTDYYLKSMEYNYQDLASKIDDMLVEAGLINALYNKYQLSYEDMTDFDGCVGGEACDMEQFITQYTSGELKDFLEEAHRHWESLVYYEMGQQEIEDSYLKLFYQDEICENYDYIDKYDVSFIVLNDEQLSKSFEELQNAYDKGYIPVTNISNYGDSKHAVPSKSALKKIELYKDINFYDGDFAKLASNTIQTLFAQDVVHNSEYLGGAELATNSQALKKKIAEAGVKASSSDATEQTRDYSKLENWNVQQYSLGDRNEKDVLYILWKINRMEHTKSIPTLESIQDKLEKKAKVYQAQKKLSAVVYAEKNKMTDEEVDSYIKEVYSGHN